MLLDFNTSIHCTLKYTFSAVICKFFCKWKRGLQMNLEEVLHFRTINTIFFSIVVLRISFTHSISNYSSVLLFKSCNIFTSLQVFYFEIISESEKLKEKYRKLLYKLYPDVRISFWTQFCVIDLFVYPFASITPFWLLEPYGKR